MSTDRNEEIDVVIRKIQKILAKRGRGATDEETDSAMRIVQELMAKHNLDMATVSAAGESPEDAATVRVDERLESRARYKWQQELAAYVAEANFCLHVLMKERVRDADGNWVKVHRDGHETLYGEWRSGTWFWKKRLVHRFIGRKANVVTAQLMFDYLCGAVERSVPVTDRTQRFTKAASSWREGCAAKLCERLAERRADLMAEHDARVKAQEEAFAADLERRKGEAQAKRLGPRPPTAEETAAKLREGARDAVGLGASASLDPERPEVVEDDWIPGAGAEPEPEVAPAGVALVLASVYDDRERELNEDVLYGLEPGTTTRRRLEWEERDRREAEEEAKREAEEEKEADSPPPVETERQRQARERREAKEYADQRRRWAREDAREERKALKEHMRRDHSAYRAGMRTGERIGLDPQMRARRDAKRLGGGK